MDEHSTNESGAASSESRTPDARFFVGGESVLPSDHRQSDGDSKEAREEDLRRAQAKIGTLLKMDNVSFLMGSGCSRHEGGVMFGSVPFQVEKYLLEKGLSEGGRRKGWLKLFYEVAALLVDKNERAAAERSEEVRELLPRALSD